MANLPLPWTASTQQCWSAYPTATPPASPPSTKTITNPHALPNPPIPSSPNSLTPSSIESTISQIRSNPHPTQKPKSQSISLDISSLEKLIAENSYFLPPYEVRTCLTTVNHLKQFLDELTSLIILKKKFSLKNKSSKNPTPTPIPIQIAELTPKIETLVPIRAAPGFRN